MAPAVPAPISSHCSPLTSRLIPISEAERANPRFVPQLAVERRNFGTLHFTRQDGRRVATLLENEKRPAGPSQVQFNAEKLAAEYGGKIVFWGGGVDTQKTLAFGTPAEVRAEVLDRCEVFGRDGGFVFNAVHNIQANVPITNIVSMFEALKET